MSTRGAKSDHFNSGWRLAQRSTPERILQRRALQREQFRAALRDVHVIFEPNPKLATNVYAGLIAERHIRRQWSGVPAHQVRPLVAVHAHAVSHAMREVFVV